MGSTTLIQVHVISPLPLPANLALSLNGHGVDADECSNNRPFASSVEMSADRTKATVIFELDNNREDYEFYFADGSSQPRSNIANLGLFSRATCADSPMQFDEVLNTQITWEPVYANGKDCGASSYVGSMSIQAQ